MSTLLAITDGEKNTVRILDRSCREELQRVGGRSYYRGADREEAGWLICNLTWFQKPKIWYLFTSDGIREIIGKNTYGIPLIIG